MIKRLSKDYHKLDGRIHVSVYGDRNLSDDEKEAFDKTIRFLLGNDFKIEILSDYSEKIMSLEVTKGIATVYSNDDFCE